MKKIVFFVMAVAAALMLSSCVLKTGDELFSLPDLPQDNVTLQKAINEVLATGAVYSAPTAGQNQQTIQLVDINADGENEAIAFFKTNEEKPLKIYIFEKIGDNYEVSAIIEGGGTDFVAIEYQQIDGEPGLELVVCRQLSDQVQKSVSVYKVDGSTVTTLMSAPYLQYKVSDLDGDQSCEVLVLNKDAETTVWYVDFYDCVQGEMKLTSSTMLSEGLETIKRMKNGTIEGGLPAVYVSGTYQSTGIVTDILICRDGVITNIAIAEGATTSIQTLMNYIIYPIDVDSDGIYEIARPVLLPMNSSEAGEVYYAITWYGITENGELIKKLSTYHNYSDSWFIILPDTWIGNISVSRSETKSGERALTFYRWTGGEDKPEAIMTIFTLSGENRNSDAEQGDRFIVGKMADYTIAASMSEESADWEYMITGEELISRFRIISSEWSIGETY